MYVCVCVSHMENQNPIRMKRAGLPWQSRGLEFALLGQGMRGSIPGGGIKILHAARLKKRKEGIYTCEQHVQAAQPGLLECECSEEGIYTGGGSVIRWESK